MKPAQHPTALRVQALLHAAGVDTQVVEFEQPTCTSTAAKTPLSVFALTPEKLLRITNAPWAAIRLD